MRLIHALAWVVAAGGAVAHTAFDPALIPAWASVALATPLVLWVAISGAHDILRSGQSSRWWPAPPATADGGRSAESVDDDGLVGGWVGLSLWVAVCIVAGWLQLRLGGAAFACAMAFMSAGRMALDFLSRLVRDLMDETIRPILLVQRGALAWLTLTLLGAALLAVPAATHPGVPDYVHNLWRHLATCAFTAASAVTCNGATIYDPHEDLRPLGLGVIFVLMELGGALFVLFGWLAMRPWLRTDARDSAHETASSNSKTAARSPVATSSAAWDDVRDPRGCVRVTPALALMIWAGLQVVGAAVTWSQWEGLSGVPQRAWWSIFSAAGALNGCGMPLRQVGLAPYLATHSVYWTMLILATLGGIGVAVAVDRTLATWKAWREAKKGEQPISAPTKRSNARNTTGGAGPVMARPARRSLLAAIELPSLELHIGLWIVCLGAGLIWLCERPDLLPDALVSSRPLYLGSQQKLLREMSAGEGWRAALLCSAAARSSGLRIAPLLEGAVSWPTWLGLIVMMIVGGGIGAAAGGLRVGTLAILARARSMRAAGLQRLPRTAVQVIGVVLMVNAAAIVTVAITQRFISTQATAAWWEIVFDSVSVANGVGWSSGVTVQLRTAARATLAVLMLIGKLTPLLLWAHATNECERPDASPARASPQAS